MRLKKLVLISLAAMMVIGAAGCGGQQKAATSSAALSGSITGSGSSALLPLVKDAAEKFKVDNKGVSINLNAGGSGTGLKQVADGSVDMGNSDVAAETKLSKDKADKLKDHKVAVMDEPTSALDPISTQKIEDLALQLKEKYTIVIVTHSMQQARRISDRTAFFLLGELIEFDNTVDMFTKPSNPKTEEYITGRFG